MKILNNCFSLQLLVTGFDLNIIFNSNEICLLDGIVKLEDEEVTLEGFASYYASGEIPVTVYRNKSLLGMQRQAFGESTFMLTKK